DSGELDTYWHTINGDKNRFKLRLRYYDARPDSPVFFEIKRRVNAVILKQRGAVRRSAVPLILSGHLPEPSHLASADADHAFATHKFPRRITQYDARPKLHVAYLREAWENPNDNSVRVTMDREVLSAPSHTGTPVVKSPSPYNVFGKQVILELKFTNRFPT